MTYLEMGPWGDMVCQVLAQDIFNSRKARESDRYPVSEWYPESDRPTSTQPYIFKMNVLTKQPYTWTHIVNSNVYVGLQRDDTPLWKCKAGLKLGGHSLYWSSSPITGKVMTNNCCEIVRLINSYVIVCLCVFMNELHRGRSPDNLHSNWGLSPHLER